VKEFRTIRYEHPAAHVVRIALKLTKEAVNVAEDIQGRPQAMQTSFALHQLAHTHWVKLHGMLIDPTGLPRETRKALGTRPGGGPG
jgi:enoyl-CoA hydratase